MYYVSVLRYIFFYLAVNN